MASASILCSAENFDCSICLDVFSRPVSTPCGHNFCKACISKFWDEKPKYKCPVCNELFHPRPDLRVNAFLSEIASQFRRSVVKHRFPDQCCVQPGEVPCDVCTGTQLKAVKSCVDCLASYCGSHLEPHQRVTGLRKHTLVDPVDNIEDRICKKHDRLLEFFCKTEDLCVCRFCTVKDHRFHQVIPLEEAYDVKRAELENIKVEVPQMIEERQEKIKKLKDTVKFSKEDAGREMADSAHVFTALVRHVEQSQEDFVKTLEEKLKSIVSQAESLIEELEQEIKALTDRSSEIKQICDTEDQLHFLQVFSSLKTPVDTRDWTAVPVSLPSFVGTLRRSLVQLGETLNMEMNNLPDTELKAAQQSEVDVTLDFDTAHSDLKLSEDGKTIHRARGLEEGGPPNPKRFTDFVGVLTKQNFSSGRFYFEVQVERATRWRFGLARESINREGVIEPSAENGYWTIGFNLNKGVFITADGFPLNLRKNPKKVGMFVDYDEGLVSFYDVEARTHIYSLIGCSFREPLHPLINACLNDDDKGGNDDKGDPSVMDKEAPFFKDSGDAMSLSRDDEGDHSEDSGDAVSYKSRDDEVDPHDDSSDAFSYNSTEEKEDHSEDSGDAVSYKSRDDEEDHSEDNPLCFQSRDKEEINYFNYESDNDDEDDSDDNDEGDDIDSKIRPLLTICPSNKLG